MFGLIELLHEFNVFETIEFNRLPVGHTHEDIDAMFGTIWTKIKQKTIKTPQEFKDAVMEAFENRNR